MSPTHPFKEQEDILPLNVTNINKETINSSLSISKIYHQTPSVQAQTKHYPRLSVKWVVIIVAVIYTAFCCKSIASHFLADVINNLLEILKKNTTCLLLSKFPYLLSTISLQNVASNLHYTF